MYITQTAKEGLQGNKKKVIYIFIFLFTCLADGHYCYNKRGRNYSNLERNKIIQQLA